MPKDVALVAALVLDGAVDVRTADVLQPTFINTAAAAIARTRVRIENIAAPFGKSRLRENLPRKNKGQSYGISLFYAPTPVIAKNSARV
jgi:hypothetical protein